MHFSFFWWIYGHMLIPIWKLHNISGVGLAFEACFKLPATCTWTQAAKASLERQKQTFILSPEEQLQCEEKGTQRTQYIIFHSVNLCFTSFAPLS